MANIGETTYEKRQKVKKACVILYLFVLVSIIGNSTPTIEKLQNQNFNNESKIYVSGKTPITPDYILASVIIFNGDIQGSGTIISKGSKWSLLLTAAHNFSGKINELFWVYYPDGTYTEAKLMAYDKERDLALAAVTSQSIISHSYIPSNLKEGMIDLVGVGYTGAQGPNVKDLKYNGAYYDDNKKYMWNLNVANGPFWDGDSGGGIFCDGGLVGVTSQRNAKVWVDNVNFTKRLYAISHSEIVAFLKNNPFDQTDFGDYSKPSQVISNDKAPPLWKPNPNVPIYINKTNSEIKILQDELKELKQKVDDLYQNVTPPIVPTLTKPQASSLNEETIKSNKDYQFLRKPSDIPETENESNF